MDTKELLSGIAVIFDDELGDENSTINRIKSCIEDDIPVLGFNCIPDSKFVSCLSNVSFIILDWDFNTPITDETGGLVNLGEELKSTNEEDTIEFLKLLLKNVFSPVFIFTSFDTVTIKDKLKELGVYNEGKNNRVFVKQKAELTDKETIFSIIENWLKSSPAIYVLKSWEKTVSHAKNEMFIDFFKASPRWTKIIWDMLEKDSRDVQKEFGDFITKHLTNRICGYSFDDSIIDTDEEIETVELVDVVEKERYICLESPPVEAHTGDLFYDARKNEYYLNIRAQCSLSRKRTPSLYLITGTKLSDSDISTSNIKLTNDGLLHIGNIKSYGLEELNEIIQDDSELITFNTLLEKQSKRAFFDNGNIIGKKCNAIIACVNGETAIRFDLDITIKKYGEMKDKIVGRILPPYITNIQQSCANYIIREGILPTPKEIFNSL